MTAPFSLTPYHGMVTNPTNQTYPHYPVPRRTSSPILYTHLYLTIIHAHPNNNTRTPNNNTHSPPYHLSTLSPLMPESRHQKKINDSLRSSRILRHFLPLYQIPHKPPSHNCLCHCYQSCLLNPLTITVTMITALIYHSLYPINLLAAVELP